MKFTILVMAFGIAATVDTVSGESQSGDIFAIVLMFVAVFEFMYESWRGRRQENKQD